MHGSVTDKPLQLTVDRDADYLLAIEFGEICDGKPESEYLAITEDVAWVFARPEGELIGFVVDDLDGFDAGVDRRALERSALQRAGRRPARGPRR